MKKNIKNMTLCAFLIAFVAIAITCFAPIIAFADDVEEGTSATLANVDQYTSSDNLRNEDGTISDYNIRDFAASSKFKLLGSYILDLEKVIPKHFLETTESDNIFQHNGAEYGFYLSKVGDCFDLLLMDFTYDTLNNYEYSMSIETILQLSFKREFVDETYRYIKISTEGRSKYYVANPRFLTFILNENQLNYGDDGYSKANDTGMIIRQSRFNYGSMLYKDEEDLILECAKIGANIVYDTTLKVIDIKYHGLGELIGYVGDAIEVGAKLYFEGNFNEIEVVSNENNILSNVTRAAQASNNNVDGFTRAAGIASQSEIVLCDDESSYAEFIVMLEGDDTKTRLIQICDFEIATRVGDWSSMDYIKDSAGNNQVFSAGKEQTLFEDASVEVIPNTNFSSTHTAYFLRDGTHTFTYTPVTTATYQIFAVLPISNINVHCAGVPVETTMVESNVVEVDLEVGNTYTFVFSQEEAGFYRFAFSPKTEAISVGSTETIHELSPMESTWFAFLNANATNVFEINYDDSYYEVTVYKQGASAVQLFRGADYCQFVAEPNANYFIKVMNRTNASVESTQLSLNLPPILSLNTISTENMVIGTRYFFVNVPVQGNYKISNLSSGLSATILSKSAVNGVYELDAGYYFVEVKGTRYSASLCVEIATQELIPGINVTRYFEGGTQSAFIKVVYPENVPLSFTFSGVRLTHIFSENMVQLNGSFDFEGGRTYYFRVISQSSSNLPARFSLLARVLTSGSINITGEITSGSLMINSAGDKYIALNINKSGVYHFGGCDDFELYDSFLEKIDINSILPAGNYVIKATGTKVGRAIQVDMGGSPIQFFEMVMISTSRVFEIATTSGKQYEIRIAKTAQHSSTVTLRLYNSNWELIPLSQNGDYYTFTSNDSLIYAQVILNNIGGGGVAFMIDDHNATASDQIISIESYEYNTWNITEKGRYFIIPAGNYTLNVYKKGAEKIQIVEMVFNGANIILEEEIIADEYEDLGTIVKYTFNNSVDKVYAIFSDQTIVDFMLCDTDAEYYIKVKGQPDSNREFVMGNAYEFELWKDVNGYKSIIPNQDTANFVVKILQESDTEEFIAETIIAQNGKYVLTKTGILAIDAYYLGINASLYVTILEPSIYSHFLIENGELVFKTGVDNYTSNAGYLTHHIDLELNGQFLGRFDGDSATQSLKAYYDQSHFLAKAYYTFMDDNGQTICVETEEDFSWNVLYIGESINDDNYSTVYIYAGNLSNTNINFTLEIPDYVDDVLIEGDGATLKNFNIYVSDRDNSLNLYLKNVNYQFNEHGINCASFVSLSLDITGDCSIMPVFDIYSGGVAIHANHLTINGTGELTVVSAKSPSVTGNVPVYNGSPGINVNTIVISVNRLTVIGGDGGDAGAAIGIEYDDLNDGKSAKSGGTGGCAISCNTDFLVTDSCTYLRLVGGSGGDGGYGANGLDGTEIGEAGGKGGHGGDGGLGGVPYDIINEDGIFYISSETEQLFVNGAYGLGGNGGNGGNGGPGGNGGNGGNGGDGLYGGRGGNGGHGGHGPSDDQFFGESNPGGHGGNGGHGGHGGYSEATKKYEAPGDGGDGGDGGDPGLTGAGTNGGNGGYGYIGGNGGNGSDAHGLFADAGDGGDGGDGYGNDAGEGGNGGDATLNANNGSDGSDGVSYTNWDNYPWNY